MSRKSKNAYVDKYIDDVEEMQKKLMLTNTILKLSMICKMLTLTNTVLMVPGNCKNAKVEISPGSLHRCGGVMRALHELPVFDEC